MDVVDTLRRDARLVNRELNFEGQDTQLIERLQEIYTSQGITVPDHILKEGVQALREDRFVYTPTPPSLSRKFANWYVNREKWGRPVLVAISGAMLSLFAYVGLVSVPQQQEAKQISTELSETLPAELSKFYDQVDLLADDQNIEYSALQAKEDGLIAIQNEDIQTARSKRDVIKNMAEILAQEYALRVISGRNSTSGVWRVPDNNPNARNYYLIVEAVNNQGKIIPLNIMNEENNIKQKVTQFGVRVPQQVFNKVLQDKQDDGIIQNNILGQKKRGALEVQYTAPVLNGTITQW
jgi:hypothetical protein